MATEIQIAQDALQLINRKGENTGVYLPDVLAQIPTVFKEVANSVRMSPDVAVRQKLQKVFVSASDDDLDTVFDVVPLTGLSVLNNSPALASPDTAIIIKPPFAEVKSPSLGAFDYFLWSPDIYSLRLEADGESDGFYHYTVHEKALWVVGPERLVDTSAIHIKANYIPNAANIPDDLVQMFVNALAEKFRVVEKAKREAERKAEK